MGIDENQISLRPGGGIKRPVKPGCLSSFPAAPLQYSSNRPSAPLNSYHRPSVSGQSSYRPSAPSQSSNRPSIPLQSSHRPSAPLQSSWQVPSKGSGRVTAGSSIQAPSRGSEPVSAASSILVPSKGSERVTAGSSIQAPSRGSEPVTAASSIGSVPVTAGSGSSGQAPSRDSESVPIGSSIAGVSIQDQAKPGVIKYSRDDLLNLERQPVQRATFFIVAEKVPKILLRDEESSSNENHNQISRPPAPAPEWRGQRAHLPQAPTEKPDPTTSRHSESMKPFPVSGPSALAKAAVPWSARRGNMSEKDRVLKTVKGILNKLTPDKFDTLKDQLLNSGITTADILQGVISLLFDKAVTEPTFCFMYAELCVHLNEGLPEFPPEEPDEKPVGFKRVLLNTCQTEFEGAANMRIQLKQMIGPERLEKEQLLKRRTLGNIRLIANLFKQKMLPKRIVHFCIQELFGQNIKAPPDAENVEALCQLFSLIGKQLEAEVVPAFDSYMARLKNVGTDSRLESRIRFMVRDVIELRANNWIPRREEVKAKTISEIHTEAERNLGLRPGGATRRLQVNDAPRIVTQDTRKPVQDYLDPTDSQPMRARIGADRWKDKTPASDCWRDKTLGAYSSRGKPALSNGMAGQNHGSSSRPYPTQPTVATSILPPVSAYRSPPLQANASTSMAAPLSINAHLLSKPPPFPSISKASALIFSNEKENKASALIFSNEKENKASALIFSNEKENKASALLFSNEKENKRLLPSGATKSSSEKQAEKPKQIQDPDSSRPPLERKTKTEKLTDVDLERKSQALLKEYFHVRDLKEARQCVQDLDSPGYHAQFLFQAISMALEHKELHVQMVVELIDHLFSQQNLTRLDIRDGFLMTAEQCDDLAIDVPLAPKYIGQLFGKSAMNGTVDLTLLYDVLTKVEDIEIRKKILDTALTIINSDPRGKQLLRLQEAELSKCQNLTEE